MERLLKVSGLRHLSELSDSKLSQKAIKGNAEAYTELVKRHKAYFYRLAYSYVKDEHQALDLVQEMTYLGLMKVHQLKQEKYFKTWMTRILIHLAVKELEQQQTVTYLEEVSLPVKCVHTKIEEKLDLYDAIDCLRTEYKTVIILKYFNDLSIDEIAALMQLSSNTIKSHLRRAKAELEHILKKGELE